MFTAIVLVTLAIGIGANTAVFSVLNGVHIKPGRGTSRGMSVMKLS